MFAFRVAHRSIILQCEMVFGFEHVCSECVLYQWLLVYTHRSHSQWWEAPCSSRSMCTMHIPPWKRENPCNTSSIRIVVYNFVRTVKFFIFEFYSHLNYICFAAHPDNPILYILVRSVFWMHAVILSVRLYTLHVLWCWICCVCLD